MPARPRSRRGSLAALAATTLAASQPAPGHVRVDTIPGTDVTFEMVFVRGGEFELGSPADEAGRDDDEGPPVRVRLSAFWIGAHEVTDDEFVLFRFPDLDNSVGASPQVAFDVDAISRPSPPYEDPAHGMGGGRHPATGMTRRSALHYARWLSVKSGRLYRLPTEAEWEYACEAGRGGRFPFDATAADATDHAWFEPNGAGTFHEVGALLPNPWGLHDLAGNVAEWVMDSYSATAYDELASVGAAVDPIAGNPPRGRGIVRGGAFGDSLSALRCADRQPEAAAWKRRDPQIPKSRWWNTDSPHVGFRLVSPAREHTLEQIHEYWAGVLGP